MSPRATVGAKVVKALLARSSGDAIPTHKLDIILSDDVRADARRQYRDRKAGTHPQLVRR